MMASVKATALLLLLAFGSLQGVSFTDCPCGSLCETKNACPDENRHESPDDCCSRSRADERRATENCFHLEPQTDLDASSPELPPVSFLILGVVDPLVPTPSASVETEFLQGRGLSPPSLDAPLFLLHSSLLI